jgi:hypothetical protein
MSTRTRVALGEVMPVTCNVPDESNSPSSDAGAPMGVHGHHPA